MGLKEAGLRGSLRNVSVGVNTIPDSDLVHRYDATILSGSDGDSVSTWPDSEGTADLSKGADTVVLRENEIGGNQAVEFDGGHMDASYSLSTPFMMFGVGYLRTDPSTDSALWSGPDVDEQLLRDGGANWEIRNTTIFDTGVGTDTNKHVWGIMYDDGTSTEFRQDGVSQATGDAGSLNSAGLNLGSNSTGGNNPAPVTWGEVLVYNSDLPQSQVDDVESYLGDKWGVTVS